MKPEELEAVVKRPGYRVHEGNFGTSVVSTPEYKADQKARNARLRAQVDAMPLAKGPMIEVQTEHQKRLARAAAGEIEAMFEVQVLGEPDGTAPRFQYKAHPTRRFKIDVAFPRYYGPLKKDDFWGGIGFEVQGNVHRIKHQFYRDMERHNALTEIGWTMYYVSGPMIRDGRALELVRRILSRA